MGSFVIVAIATLASALIITPVWAQAEDRWRLLEKGEVTTKELDTHSIVPIDAGQYRVWIRSSYKDGTKILQQEDYDCLQRRWRLISVVGYSPGGAPMNAPMDFSKTATWKPAIPGSTGESDLELLCGIALKP